MQIPDLISLLLAEYVALKAIIPLSHVSVSLVYVLFRLHLTSFLKYSLLQLQYCTEISNPLHALYLTIISL